MTRVMVVGADIQGERALLERLRGLAGQPLQARQGIRACRAVDDCDVVVVAQDSMALRRVAQGMVRRRPGLPLWIEDPHGELRDGRDPAAHRLREADIRAVLTRDAAAPAGMPTMRRTLRQYLALLPWRRTG